jgi:hypothetical protein
VERRRARAPFFAATYPGGEAGKLTSMTDLDRNLLATIDHTGSKDVIPPTFLAALPPRSSRGVIAIEREWYRARKAGSPTKPAPRRRENRKSNEEGNRVMKCHVLPLGAASRLAADA